MPLELSGGEVSSIISFKEDSEVLHRMKAHVERMRPQADPSPEALGEYRGKWIAVLHGAIVASGDRALEVLRRMDEEHPGEKPVVYRVPAGEVMLL